jgi:hypothetical protein
MHEDRGSHGCTRTRVRRVHDDQVRWVHDDQVRWVHDDQVRWVLSLGL